MGSLGCGLLGYRIHSQCLMGQNWHKWQAMIYKRAFFKDLFQSALSSRVGRYHEALTKVENRKGSQKSLIFNDTSIKQPKAVFRIAYNVSRNIEVLRGVLEACNVKGGKGGYVMMVAAYEALEAGRRNKVYTIYHRN